MGLIISKKNEIERYFENKEYISQSDIKPLLNSLESYIEYHSKKDKLESSAMTIGSIVDTILTGNENDFQNTYYTLEEDFNYPSDTQRVIVETVYNKVLEKFSDKLQEKSTKLEDFPNEILYACSENNWQNRYKDETKIKKIVEECTDYFSVLKESSGKIIIDFETLQICNSVVESLKNSSNTKFYFDKDAAINSSEYDIFYQYPLYFEIEGVKTKGLLDIVLAFKDADGHYTSAVPIDLKTTSYPTSLFLDSLRKFRYDIQAAWYTRGLKQDPKFQRAKIENFKFIVESTKYPGNPLIYECSDDLLFHGVVGNAEFSGKGILYSKIGRFNKGYLDLIKEFKFYLQNGFKESYLSKVREGVVQIDFNKIWI